jgi:tRNA modification GTPase
MDTIFALASARGKAGVAVLRVSGPGAKAAAEALTGAEVPARRPVLRDLKGHDGGLIDRALVIAFDAGASFTGEAVVEFQTHGSLAVIAALEAELGRIPGLRPAAPGEFTRRALENERLDLTQVEGLADLIEAETEAQRRQALRVADGALRAKSDGWRRDLIRAAALIEATIDFADEEVPTDVTPEVLDLTGGLLATLEAEIAGTKIAERVRDGFEVAIIGKPNLGKSTLLNALAGREAAITSEIAGTTRDVIEVRMDLRGLPVTFLDTAGLRETEDPVEQLGVDRARQRAELADLRVLLIEPGEDAVSGPDDLLRTAKGDLRPETPGAISGATGLGVTELIDEIAERLAARTAAIQTATHARQRLSIEGAVTYITAARTELGDKDSRAEVVSENLHQAIRALDLLIGQVDVEHVLDEIFASFCLGK